MLTPNIVFFPEYDVESKTRELREVKSKTAELDKTVKQRNEEIGNLMKKTAAMEKEVSFSILFGTFY